MSETSADERARLRLTARQRLTTWGHISRALDEKETFDMRPEWAAQIEELTKERDESRLALLAERARAERLEHGRERLRNIVESLIGMLENCSVESGACCCGDFIKNHSSPTQCGHDPVDSGAYDADSLLKDARAAVAAIADIADEETAMVEQARAERAALADPAPEVPK